MNRTDSDPDASDWGIELVDEDCKLEAGSDSEGIDESESLLAKASGSRAFPELVRRRQNAGILACNFPHDYNLTAFLIIWISVS